MAQQFEIGKTATTVKKSENKIIVTYHATNVFTIDLANNTITLNTDGWYTQTTKTRMNQAFHQFGYLSYNVTQRDNIWYVINQTTGETIPYIDGMIIQI